MRRLGDGDRLGRGGGGGGGPRGDRGGADELDPGDQGGPGAGEAPLRHRDPHDRGAEVGAALVFRELWSVISEMATWSESTERGWYLGHGRHQVVR